MRRTLQAAAMLVSLAATTPARAQTGEIRGAISVARGAAGTGASQVVVYLIGFEEDAPDQEVRVQQRGKKFVPSLVAVTAGQTVSFPNGDPFFHNVFSPSVARTFDLGQYRAGETKRRQLLRPGVVDVYCNIHPEMSATILVLPNRRFAMTRKDGSFTIRSVPSGRWKLYAYSRGAERPVGVDVEVQPGKTTTVYLEIVARRSDFRHRNKYGEKYRDPAKYR
jgi:plastocyanin